MSNKITDIELKEMGVSRELFDSWLNLMKCLYNWCKSTFDETEQCGNLIKIKNLEISANMINGKYINVSVHREESPILEIRYDGQLYPIIECVKQVLFFNMKYKPVTKNKHA